MIHADWLRISSFLETRLIYSNLKPACESFTAFHSNEAVTFGPLQHRRQPQPGHSCLPRSRLYIFDILYPTITPSTLNSLIRLTTNFSPWPAQEPPPAGRYLLPHHLLPATASCAPIHLSRSHYKPRMLASPSQRNVVRAPTRGRRNASRHQPPNHVHHRPPTTPAGFASKKIPLMNS
jgi:hypothetical protein